MSAGVLVFDEPEVTHVVRETESSWIYIDAPGAPEVVQEEPDGDFLIVDAPPTETHLVEIEPDTLLIDEPVTTRVIHHDTGEEVLALVSEGLPGPRGDQGPQGPPGDVDPDLPSMRILFENGLY